MTVKKRRTLSTTNPTYTGLELNPGLCGVRPAKNSMRHCTASDIKKNEIRGGKFLVLVLFLSECREFCSPDVR